MKDRKTDNHLLCSTDSLSEVIRKIMGGMEEDGHLLMGHIDHTVIICKSELIFSISFFLILLRA